MKIVAEIEFEIDDEMMANHDGDHKTPPNEVDDWNLRDLFDAYDQELLDLGADACNFYIARKEKS